MTHYTDIAVALRDIITERTARADPRSTRYDPNAVCHTSREQEVSHIVQSAVQHVYTYDRSSEITVYGRSNIAAHTISAMVTDGEGRPVPKLTLPFEEQVFDFLFYDLAMDYSVHGQNGKSWEEVEAMISIDYRDSLYILSCWFAAHGRLWDIWQTIVEQYHAIWQDMPHPQYHQSTKDTMRNTLAIYLLTRVDAVLVSGDSRFTDTATPWVWRSPLIVEQIVQSVQSNAPLLSQIHHATYYDQRVERAL